MPHAVNRAVELSAPESESAITLSWCGFKNPTVSICCATYNHDQFLEQCIRGILAQKTNFPFEIIVRDDASTDGTPEIARYYAQKYPRIVRAVIEPENQFKKGIRPLHVWPVLARGEFVALCEGDDFWTDPLKLQKQVDLLRKYPESVMSVAKTEVWRQEGTQMRFLYSQLGPEGKVLLDCEEVARHYFHTSSYVIRSKALAEVVSKYFSGHCLFGDTALRSILSSIGPFAFLPEVVSVYRETGGGIWTSLDRAKQVQWEIQAAKKLSLILTGRHRRLQEGKLFRLCLSEMVRAFKARQIKAALTVLPSLFTYAVLKVSNHARERGARVFGVFK